MDSTKDKINNVIKALDMKIFLLNEDISDRKIEIKNALHYAETSIEDIKSAYEKGLLLEANNIETYARQITDAVCKIRELYQEKKYIEYLKSSLEDENDEKILCNDEQ